MILNSMTHILLHCLCWMWGRDFAFLSGRVISTWFMTAGEEKVRHMWFRFLKKIKSKELNIWLHLIMMRIILPGWSAC